MTARRVATDGFSLLELVVVIAVMSTLAVGVTLALPRGTQSDAAVATALLAEARQVRHAAMITGDRHALILGQGQHEVERKTGGLNWSAVPGTARDFRADLSVLSGTFSEVGEIGVIRLEFLPDGDVVPIRFTLNSDILCQAVDGDFPTCGQS